MCSVNSVCNREEKKGSEKFWHKSCEEIYRVVKSCVIDNMLFVSPEGVQNT